MARFDPKTYAKNVLRSAGYITVESIKGVNPTLTSYITETASSAKEMYDFAKDFKRNIRNKLDETDGRITKEFDKQRRNILDDIRTGKFYNPEREKAALNEYMKKEGFSFDDLDFDIDEDFGEDSSESSSGETKAINSLSMTQQKLTAASTDEIVRAGRANTKLSIKTTNKMFGIVNNSLAVINTSILNLHQDLAKPINAHIINSGNFYQAATQEMAMQTKYLENINRILTERYETKKKGFTNSGYKTSAWEDVFGNGLPNLKNWGKHAKTKFMNSTTLGAFGDLFSSDMLNMLLESGAISSPIAQLAVFGITNKLQSSKFGKSLNRTEDILRGGFTQLAGAISARARNASKNRKGGIYGGSGGILNSILEALDIVPKANKKIDHSRYNKGPIDWDGESKKALTEVIPTQLAMIIAQLGGTPKTFNYKTGRWETVSQTVKQFKEERRKAIASENYRFKDTITRDFIDEYNSKLSTGESMMTYRSKGTLTLSKDFDRVMEYFTLNNIDSFSDASRVLDDLARKGIINKKSADQLKRSFNKHAGAFSSSIYNSRVGNNKFMANAGQGNFGMISNGSGLAKANYNINKNGAYSNSILALKDNKGHDIYFYLQSFYSSFKYLEDALSTQNYKKGRGKRLRRSGNKYDVPLSEEFREIQEREERLNQSWNARESSSGHDTDELDSRDGIYKKSSYNKTEQRARDEGKSSIFTRGMEKVNDTLSKIFFGNNNINQMIANGGLLGAIKDLPKNIAKAIDELKDKAKNWLGEKWRSFKESDFGREYFDSMKDQVRGMGRSAWGHARQSAGQVVEFFSNRGFKPRSSAARGGFVTKSGMISVSEGEMIIPSERNPYYRGRTNKSSQRAQEAMNYRKWLAQGGNKDDYWGSFSKGTDFVRDLYSENISIDEIKERFKQKFGSYPSSKTLKKGIDQAASTIKNTGSKFINKGKETFNKFIETDYGQKMKDLLNKADQAMTGYFGDKYKDSKDVAKSAMNVIKNSLPQTMSSGTIGAIIAGAMTGSGLGLLGGFAIGAGVHVLKNSDDISKKLFGDEEGKGGMLPPKVSNFIKKRLPKLAKSGAIGSVLGAMGIAPGGLLGGFVLGAGIDMLAHQEKVQEFISSALFGNEGVDGKRRGGIIGSLKVRVVDPLADYVKTGIGKVKDFFKNTVFTNVKKLFDPLTDWVKGKGTKMLDEVTGGIKSIIHRIGRNIGEIFNKTIGRLLSAIGFTGDKALTFGGKLAALPFKGIGGLGDALNRHNIRMGYSSASAAERVAAMGDKATNYDKTLAAYETSGNIKGAKDFVQRVHFYANSENNARKALASQREDLADTMVATLDNGGAADPKIVNALRSAMRRATTTTKVGTGFNKKSIQHTDYSGVIADIKAGKYKGITDKRAEEAIKLLTAKQAEFNERYNQLDNWGAAQEAEFSKDEYKGYDLRGLSGKLSDKKLLKLRHQTNADLRKISENDRKLWLQDENKTLADRIEQDKNEHPLDDKRNTILENILTPVKAIAQHLGVNLPEKNSFDKAKENTKIPSKESKQTEDTGPKEGAKRQNPTTGENEEYRGGKWVPDLSDQETKDKKNEEKEEKNLRTRFYNFFLGGGLFTSLRGIFGINKEEKKETIFDKIKNLIPAIMGGFSSIGKMLSEGLSSVAGALGPILGGAAKTVGSIATGAVNNIGGIGAGIGLGGTLLSGLSALSKYGKDGLPAVLSHLWDASDEKEAKLLGYDRVHYGKDEYQTNYTAKRTFLNTLKQATLGRKIPGLAGGVYNVAGKAIRNTPKAIVDTAKGGYKIFKKAKSAIGNNGFIGALKNGVKFIIEKACGLVSKLTGVKIGAISGEVIEESTQEIVEGAATKVGKEATEKALSKVALALQIANIVLAVENGWEDAQANIGLLDEPSIGERFLSAIAEGISELIFRLLTPEFLIDKLLWVADFFGFDVSDMQERREKAKAEMKAYNETIGKDTGKTYNTVKEYLKNTKGLYTTQDKIKRTIGAGVSKVWGGVKTVGGKAFGLAKKGATIVGKGIIKGGKKIGKSLLNSGKKIMSSITSNIKGIGSTLGETFEPAMNAIKAGLDKIHGLMPYVPEAIKSILTMTSNISKHFRNPETGIKEMMAEKVKISNKNPLKPAAETLGTGLKVLEIPMLFVGAAFGKVFRSIVAPVAKSIVPSITTSIGVVSDNISSFIKGDIKGLWTNQVVADDDTGGVEGLAKRIGSIVNIGTSLALTTPTLISFGIRKVVGAIGPVAKGLFGAAKNIGTNVSNGLSYMKAGDLSALASLGINDNENSEGTLGGMVSTVSGGLVSSALFIPTVGYAISNKISELWNNKVKETSVGQIISKLWSYSDNKKDMNGYNKDVESFYNKNDSPMGIISNIGVRLTGFVMYPFVQIARFLNGIKNGLADTIDNFKNWLLGKDEPVSLGTSTTYTNASAGNMTFGGTTGAQFDTTGTGSGVHVSQKGSNRKFGSSNVDENGCGPATAATVLRAYGRGGNLNDAVTWAEAGGYVAGASGVGTRASYFSDILGANGIRTSYTNSKNSIRGAVGSGNPTILLGQDRSNKSKVNSPFGPNPHYVVARGSDSRGNVLIDDPELGAPTVYNKKILNNAKLGILTGGGSNAIQADDGAVWNYLKSAGLTDAGVAGLMGNLYAESGIKSNKVEASSIKKSSIQSHDYSRDHGFTYDSDSYTAAVDKGLKEGLKGSAEQNLKPTFGVIPEYEFTHMPWKTDRKKSDGTYFGQNGYGLVQWTTINRKQGLYNLAKSKGVSISDKKMQLEYLLGELQSKFPGVYNTLKTTSSLAEASNKVLVDFESPKNAMSKSSERASYGQTYYDAFSKNPPTDTSFGASTALGESGGGQTISFPTYNLTDSQLKGVANIIQHEQSGVQARYAEASLMANLIDMKDDSRATAQNLVDYLQKPPGKNWFAHGRDRYNAGAAGSVKIENTALAAATDIFNNGKRTMPRYINEHDCFSDISSTNPTINIKDRSAYVPNQTKVHNRYGSSWMFYSFPDAKSDPFGYTSEEMRSKHGDAHYDIDASGTVTAPAGYSTGTSGSSGSSGSNGSSGESSKPTNLAGILASAFSTVFGAIGSKLTGKAGSIFKLLTGGINLGGTSSSESTTSSDGTSSTGTDGSISTTMAGDSTPKYGGSAKTPVPQGKGTPQSMVQIAQSQLGVVEGPEGSNNGNITDYGKFTGMDHQPWCASFVSWVMDKTFNGDKTARNKALRGNISAAVSGLWDNFKSAGAMTNEPQPGDVVIFKNGSSHTGIVETVNGKQISTIEGNTGSSNEFNRNGGVVARHQWTLGDGSSMDKKLTGFGRPDWSGVTASGSGLPLYKYIGGKSAAGASSEYDYDDRDDGHAKPYPTGYGTPHSMIEIARSQLGVLEGGLGEKDKSGKWIPHSGNITDYGKFMGMDKQPWCASFVSWVMDKTFNGAKNKRNYALRGNPSAAVDGLWSNFKAAGEMHDIPEPGDVVIYKNDTSHTGIVETVNGKHITTIEGNTSSGNTFDRNGGIVFRKEFTIGDGSSMANKLTGFGRPNWDAEKEFGTGSGLLYHYGGASGVSSLDKALKNGSYSNKYKNLNNSINTMQNIKATNKSSANFHKLDSIGMSEYNRRKAEKAWNDEQRAINETIARNKAAASWEADNEAIRKMQNNNYYVNNAAKIWDDEQRAINETIARNKAAASWEADNEAIRKMQNENYAKAHSTSSSSSSGYSSSSSSSGSYSGTSAPVANTVGGSIDATSLNSILEYLKIIAENSKYEATLPTIVDLVSKLAGITATINSNSTTTENQDKVNSINSGISSIIQKLDTISSTL